MTANVSASTVYLIDQVTDLRPTHPTKVGNFGDVRPSQSLGLVLKKLNQTQQKETRVHNKINYDIK